MMNLITNEKTTERALRRSRRYARKSGRARFYHDSKAVWVV